MIISANARSQLWWMQRVSRCVIWGLPCETGQERPEDVTIKLRSEGQQNELKLTRWKHGAKSFLREEISHTMTLRWKRMAPWRNPEKTSETRAERPSRAEGRVRLERQMAMSWILAFTLRMMGAIRHPSKCHPCGATSWLPDLSGVMTSFSRVIELKYSSKI